MEDAKEYIATMSSKGQVTIPNEIRQLLYLAPQDKVIFQVLEGGRIEIKALPMTLEKAYGSVSPLNRPEDFKAMSQIAREEREIHWLNKLKQ